MVRIAVLAGVLAAVAVAALATVVPIDVRHSAPYGFSLTADFRRSIAVSGGYIRPNYDHFNRLDLDLRAYTVGQVYDLTIHIRPAEPGAPDVRQIPLDVPAERIFHAKKPFANPFLTVRFPEIRHSAGKTYYVWVETGPRNRDAVIALWSIKSYSRLTGWTVLSTFLQQRAGDGAAARVALILLAVAIVTMTGVIVAVLTELGLGERAIWPRIRGEEWHRHERGGIQ
jgi:hypothetical protein